MNIKETKSEGLSREYNVTVSASDYSAEVTKKLKEIAKTVSIAGFRAGKVPFSMVEKKYKEQASLALAKAFELDGANIADVKGDLPVV